MGSYHVLAEKGRSPRIRPCLGVDDKEVTSVGRKGRDLRDPRRWGLPPEAVAQLGERLHTFWQRFAGCFRTRTRDGSKHAYHYLQGQLIMDDERNFANIARRTTGEDGQALQHFMSNFPWSGAEVFFRIQAEIKATPVLAQGGILILDESADEKAGMHNAGASRQYSGRLGKVDVCRVDTCLVYHHPEAGIQAIVDGELFLPQEWFLPEASALREELGIPKERKFETKIALGWKMIQRAKANGLPFELVACDALYGRDGGFRAALDEEGILYAAEVPGHTRVYLREPRVNVPRKRSKVGRPRTRPVVVSRERPQEVRALARSPTIQWHQHRVRHAERGWLEADFAVVRVYVIREGGMPRPEWLVMRRDADGDYSYTLLNASQETPEERLIEWSCQRYFVERAFEDAKSELGWDDFQAQKYRAWEHHLALTALALWFIAQTKLEWAQLYARDPELARQLEVEVLPTLSTANVRELLKATLPLQRLTPQEATALVIEHLIRRARSTRSRLKRSP